MRDLSIVLCGEAGSGIQTVERVLSRVLKLAGYNVFATKEYMSRIRGGMNSAEIRIGSRRVDSFVDKIDIIVVLNKGAIKHLENRISERTVIIGEKTEVVENERHLGNFVPIALREISEEIGGEIYKNMVSVGVLVGLFRVRDEIIEDYIKSYFSEKGTDTIDNNIRAVKKGKEISVELAKRTSLNIDISQVDGVDKEILINGTEAVALGALAGGCNFISFYPMSPSTGIAVFLAQHADEFGVIVEQTEDEIAAINMALGAWYAGGRALITTSGGGFALMVEGLSLSAMIESPAVIHLGQRPGPATGLPTRMGQEDLLFTLFAGHGEFPRVIYAPGSLQDAFSMTQNAFIIADKYQVPVFILTDQYFLDSYYNLPDLDILEMKNEFQIKEVSKEYKRYEITESGISPRGVPGYGDGLVTADSDEHDESGHITEDHEIRVRMVKKRLEKMKFLEEEVIPPELIGSENYKILLVGWGSSRNVIKEALMESNRDDIAFLHFKQVYPLAGEIRKYLENAAKTVVIENNATSQFGRLIKLETGFEFEAKLLKYNGLAFSVEEITEFISKL
ncbi:2-oxoacid:acceptor oxidoreductase subunit alpha [bacterium]|nr:2-oxoacid:acceptor oxidoreductase subunit alpha [bacterium]